LSERCRNCSQRSSSQLDHPFSALVYRGASRFGHSSSCRRLLMTRYAVVQWISPQASLSVHIYVLDHHAPCVPQFRGSLPGLLYHSDQSGWSSVIRGSSAELDVVISFLPARRLRLGQVGGRHPGGRPPGHVVTVIWPIAAEIGPNFLSSTNPPPGWSKWYSSDSLLAPVTSER
jgi:hypothetical protein